MDYALIYLLLIGVGVLMYVLLDGFSLGVGVISPWLKSEEQRAEAMRSLSHLWDSNQTWLVFGGVTLFVAFPEAYARILSELYLPCVLMVIALIFRGIAFEFRFKADTSVFWWDLSFAFGSVLATLCQGVILASLIQGMGEPVEASLNWLTPFTLLTAVALLMGYGLLGACYLIRKGTHNNVLQASRLARALVVGVLLSLAAVSVWMFSQYPQVTLRWIDFPGNLLLAPLPVIAAGLGWGLFRTLAHPHKVKTSLKPLFMTMGIFAVAFAGLVAGVFPYIIPGKLTIWQAITPDNSASFALVGIVLFLPLILAYNAYNLKVFSGTTKGGY